MSFKIFLLPYIGLTIWIVGAFIGGIIILASAFSNGIEQVIGFYSGIGIIIFAFIFGKYLKHQFKAKTGHILWHDKY